MFEELKSAIESHPYIIGGVVLVGIVLIVASRSGSSTAAASTGTSTVVQSGPSDAVQEAGIAAGAQQASDQNAAVLANNQLNATLAAKQLDDATDVTIAGYQKDVSLQTLSTQADTQANANNFAYKTTVAQTTAQTTINKQNNDAAVSEAAIAATAQQSYFSTLLTAIFGNGSASGVSTGSTPPASTLPTTSGLLPTPPNFGGINTSVRGGSLSTGLRR